MYATNLFERMEIIEKEDYQNMGGKLFNDDNFTIPLPFCLWFIPIK